jgi:hypothetical protein
MSFGRGQFLENNATSFAWVGDAMFATMDSERAVEAARSK